MFIGPPMIPNPVVQTKKIFFIYMDRIKLKHGLIFRSHERKILNKKSNFKWESDQSFSFKDEKEKALQEISKVFIGKG